MLSAVAPTFSAISDLDQFSRSRSCRSRCPRLRDLPILMAWALLIMPSLVCLTAAHEGRAHHHEHVLLCSKQCYDENCICATAVCASNFCPFLHNNFSRTSGLNSIF